MADYGQEHATEAHWRASVARSEGRPEVAGAWESAAEAWLQGRAALADSVEREAGRMQFAAEVRRHIASARSSLQKEMRQIDLEEETDDDFTATFMLTRRLIDIEETWGNVAEWADDNPAATDAWADTLVLIDDGLVYAERQWQGVHSSSDFLVVLTNWIRAAKARINARVNLVRLQNDLVNQSSESDRQQIHFRCMAWEEAVMTWYRANKARTIGNIEEADALEYIAGSLEHAAASPAVRKLWFVLHQIIEARDAGHAEIALAWEKAAQALRNGEDNLADIWERAALELEDALAEEEPAEHPGS